jgi:hypothetical protein
MLSSRTLQLLVLAIGNHRNEVTKMKGKLIYTLAFSDISLRDVPRVGGKNASLGELYNSLKSKGIGALDGYATTPEA